MRRRTVRRVDNGQYDGDHEHAENDSDTCYNARSLIASAAEYSTHCDVDQAKAKVS